MLTAGLAIVFIGMIVWAINAYLPLPDPFKSIIMFIAVIFVIIVLWNLVSGHPIPLR